MSYVVLARKYRSNTFDEIVGQTHVAQTLKRAIETDRIAHAFLFCGTRGVGKTSMARILAKALNCQSSDKPTPTPCGKCSSCQAIKRGDDIDVIEIDAASNTGVDNVRDLIGNAQYRPVHSRFKIYIIDEVHMLSKQAFNALLKTMEEPPEHVKFILATTEPEKVLPTILSRCQRYDFRNIPTREIAQHLEEICKEEKIKADDDALLLVAKAGAGSMRDSLSLLDRLLSAGEKHLTVDMIEQLLGLPKSQLIFELADRIGNADVKATLESADAMINAGLSPDTLIAGLVEHFRNLLVLRACGRESNLVEIPGISLDELAQQADRCDDTFLAQDITILEELRRSIRTSQAGRALLDATLVRLALSAQFAGVNEMLDRLDEKVTPKTSVASSVQQKKKSEPLIASPPVTQIKVDDESDDDLPAPGKVWQADEGPSLAELVKQHESADSPAKNIGPNIEPVDPANFSQIWNRLLGALESKGPALPAMLSGATFAGIENDQAILRYPHDHGSVVRMLDRNGKKDLIRELLSEILNRKVGVRFELEAPIIAEPIPATTPPRKKNPPPPAQPAPIVEPSVPLTEALRAQLAQDDLVKAVIEKLGGEIVKVTDN